MLLNKREGTCLCAAQLWWTGASRPLSPPPKDKSRVTKDPALFRIPPHSQQPSPRRSVTLPLSPPPARLGTTTAIGDHDPNRPTLGAAVPPGPSTPPPQLGSLPPGCASLPTMLYSSVRRGSYQGGLRARSRSDSENTA